MGNCCFIDINEQKLQEIELKDNSVKLFSFNGLKCKARIIDVYDGDTFTACFMHKDEIIKVKCRCNGYDSPEMKPLLSDPNRDKIKEMAIKAKERFCELVKFNKPKQLVDLQCYEFEKYGRLLCDVYVDKIHINSIMLKEGHGKEYSGGTKDSFI